MAVVEERQGNEAELARAWVECRSRVLRATTRSFPTAGSVIVEAAVDQAWVELYEQGHTGPPERLLSRWKGLAYLRALNGVRERRRHPVSSVPVEELPESGPLVDSRAAGAETLRAEARAQEIVRQVSGDARRWLEAVFDAPSAPPREIAKTLGWEPEKLKSVARRARPRLREFVSARATGVICKRRQAMMEAFAATHLAQQDPAHAARLGEHPTLGPERYQQVALHIAGCEECERAWHNAQSRLSAPTLGVLPDCSRRQAHCGRQVGDRGGPSCAGGDWIALSGICGCGPGLAWGGRLPVERRERREPPERWRVRAQRCAWVWCAPPGRVPPRSWACRRASSPTTLFITATAWWRRTVARATPAPRRPSWRSGPRTARRRRRAPRRVPEGV